MGGQRRMTIGTPCLIAMIFSASTAKAGAWVQPEAGGFYKLGGRFVQARNFVVVVPNADGEGTHAKNEPIPTLRDYTLSFYGEYGLTDQLTLVANVPLFRRITLNRQIFRDTGATVPGVEGFAANGLADADLGARVLIARLENTVLSGGLMIGVPIGTVRPPAANSTESDPGLYTSDGEFNFFPSLNAGHSFGPLPLYVTASLGFNIRTRGFSHEVHYSLEAGYTFADQLTVLLRARGVEPIRNGDSPVLGMTLGNDQRYLAYGPEVVYRFLDRFGVSAAFETAALLENTLSGPALSFGLFAQL